MKNATLLQCVAVSLAVVGMCLPQMAMAAQSQSDQVITDIQLREGGVLVGQVVSPENVGLVGTPVSLASGQQAIAQGRTNGSGYFAFSGLQSGVYQVATTDGSGTYRVWAEGTAPPSAQPGALLVTGSDTVRGQHGMTMFRNIFANPLLVAAIVATAIAVPVAIHNSNRSSSP